MKLESGKVSNETKTTYTAKDESGKQVTEEVTKNKDTGEVTRKLDGKPVEAKENVDKSVILKYSPSNAEFISIKLLEMICNQLKENAYYLRLIAGDKVNQEDLMKEIKKSG